MHRPIGIVGNFNADLVVGPVKRLPVWDEEVMATGATLSVAGTAGYMALAAHALGLEPRIVSTIGDDQTGRALMTGLADRGIPQEGVVVLQGEPTPIGVVIVGPGGKRCIVSVNGAHDRMDLEVYRSRHQFVAPCAEVVICGTYLLPKLGLGEAMEVALNARSKGQLVVFDPSWDPADWPEENRRATLDLLAHVDVYTPNDAEILRLTEAANWEDALRQVGRICSEVVVKRGAAGSAALVDGELYGAPALAVEAVDTIGAGDTFDMGYLWARRQGWPVTRRLAFANALAGIVVSGSDRATFPDVTAVMTRAGL